MGWRARLQGHNYSHRRHETDLLGPGIENVHTDPFDVQKTAAALGSRTFDLAVVMYGRLRELALLLDGKVGHFVSIGGVGVYLGLPIQTSCFSGNARSIPSTSSLVGDEEHFRSCVGLAN